jgi:phage terminase large subunit
LYKEIPRYYHSLIIPAQNDVLEGIETVASLISNDGFYVAKRCENVLKELESYSWDSKAAERGEDKPIKENDHTLDGIRYVIFTMKHEFKVRKVS